MNRLQTLGSACASTLLGIASLAVLAGGASAAAPGVPALPSADADYVGYAVTNLPEHFTVGALAAANNTPVDNPISNAGATLGRVLFYDKRLSHNNGTACASCHQQQFGFDDPGQLSTGFEGGSTGRHSMALANGAYYANGRAFWDERAASLEEQALGPIQDAVEMGSDLGQLREELAATDFYPKLFEAAFGTPDVTDERIGKSIAQFVRSMVSYQSKYDQAVVAGTPNRPEFEATFTAEEYRGNEIFHTTGKCSQCHTTHAQVGDRARNIGLDIDNSADEGAGNGAFKTVSLRNVAERERFMHDGRFDSLLDVVEFYNSGVQPNPDLDNRLKDAHGDPLRLNLSPSDKLALVAFLETLTDETFLTSELFSDPFVELQGDYNGDGLVDDADYDLWSASYGLVGTQLADGNLDGIVDARDYTVWRDNYGRSWEDLALPAGLAVPEPGVAALAFLASVLVAASGSPRRLRPAQ